MDKEQLKEIIKKKLTDSRGNCEFKKAFIPGGWACIIIERFADELAAEIVAKLGKL